MGRGTLLLLLSLAVTVGHSKATAMEADGSIESSHSKGSAKVFDDTGMHSDDKRTSVQGIDGELFVPHEHDGAGTQSSASAPARKVLAGSDGAAVPTTNKSPEVAKGGHGLHVETGMLFLRKSLHPGATLPEGTKLAGNGLPAPRSFISRAAAASIPFAYEQLETILSIFSIPPGSTRADQVAATLRTCEDDASPELHSTCATSDQAAAEFAAGSLGTSCGEPRAVVTVVHGKEDAAAPAGRYVVAEDGIARIGGGGGGGGRRMAGGAVVPCHPMAYPYMVHYCHRAVDVEALRVVLTRAGHKAAAATAAATAIAVCHSNTTGWDDRYFQMLGAARGEEICHFMPLNYVLWLPASC
ncbi:hypothetical protein ACP4OV_006463 [Aristida adscensionis]